MNNLVAYKNFIGLNPNQQTTTGGVVAGVGGLACAAALYYFLIKQKKWLWVTLLGGSQLLGMIARSQYPTGK